MVRKDYTAMFTRRNRQEKEEVQPVEIVLVGPTLPLLRSRKVKADAVRRPADLQIDFKVLKKPTFLILAFSSLFQGLVFYLPGIYLPSFAADLGINPTRGALLLSLLNLTQIVGQVAIGHVSDYLDVHILLAISTLGSAIVVFTLWLLAQGCAPLAAFSLLYGLFAGGYSVLYPRFVTTLTDGSATGLWLYGIFGFERGLGNVLAGPISGLLILSGLLQNAEAVTAAYKPLMLFVGLAFVVSSFGGIGSALKSRR
ncbi:hypothetical protein H2199_008554 [Coniosporium tulheliwenetii]|uniref:Uncharacterized protein n=1 Tax=Coniosporium tulheliwenetii TaxID=3383036 RepID=A0ACC2YIR3_9PEZI|nr:hypothetical protein H2199_008554 [Cladosporium sp. JES 115]